MREGWKEVRLNKVVWFQRGFDLPKTKFKKGAVPVFGSTSILGYHSEVKVKAPGVITGRSGTLGKFQLATKDFWPHNTTLWVKDFKGNDVIYCYYMLQCLDFSILNTGGAVPTLNRNLLNSFIVNLPPLPTQRKIASILSAYDDLIENNLKRIKLLEEKAQLTYEEWFVRMKFPGHETVKVDEETGLPEGWERKTIVTVKGVVKLRTVIYLSRTVDEYVGIWTETNLVLPNSEFNKKEVPSKILVVL
jgi:type I restriction enzyme, S subunit